MKLIRPVSALKRMVLKRRGYGSCVQMICRMDEFLTLRFNGLYYNMIKI